MRLLGLTAAAAAVCAVVRGEEAAATDEAAAPASMSTSSFFFAEDFSSGDAVFEGAWAKSGDQKYAGQPVSVSEGGLFLKNANQHYGVGAAFAKPFDVSEKDFVIQYEVKLTEGLTCGGAYVKVLKAETDLDMATINNESPYVIMFGPDACGDTNKVHFIMRHQNPISGEWEEKHAQNVPAPRKDRKSHVYTLIIRTDNTYEIIIDLEDSTKGSLLEDMVPPVNPPKQIDDPEDFKPADWVDEKMIPDPDASKPDDWDEDAPKKILDMDAVKPSDWLDEEPDEVPDPDAEMPDDWDEEEDGEWEAPLVANPKCKKASGCGEWKRPMKENPDYKGKWVHPKIDNPAYKGEWKARQIDNPNYFEDSAPHNMAKMGAVAVEIWTTNGGIRMDNFVVDHDIAKTRAFAEATYSVKAKEEAAEETQARERVKREQRDQMREAGGVWNMIQVYAGDALDYAVANPIPAVATLVVVLVSLIFLLSGKSKKPEEETEQQEEEEEEEDEADDTAGADDDDEDDDEDDEPASKPKGRKRTPKAS